MKRSLIAGLFAGLLLGAAGGWLLHRWLAAPPAAPRTLYVVQRIHWAYYDRSESLRESEPGGAGFPEKVFASRGAAEDCCQAQNLAARPQYSIPFYHGRSSGRPPPSLERYSSTPTGEFFAWLEREGVKPPAEAKAVWERSERGPDTGRFGEESFSAWCEWWNGTHLTDEQRARVWDKLDRVRFYEVLEVEAGP